MTKIELVVGNKYIIDEEYANSGLVKLIKIYGKYFCRVRDTETGGEWDTMCDRLTEIKK